MKAHYLLLFCLLVVASACSQQASIKNEMARGPSIHPKLVPVAADPFSYISQAEIMNWHNIEASVSAQYKDSVVTALAPFFNDFKTEYNSNIPLAANVHLLELNGDGHLDVIYNGTVNAESDAVWLFINQKDHYQKLPQEWWGQIKELSFTENRLATFTILDFGCCAEYIAFETTYAVDQRLKAIPVLQRGTAFFTQRPRSHVLAKPQFFALSTQSFLATDSIPLRTAPVIDDTSTRVADVVGKGNCLLMLGKGAKGFAWANQVDSLGQQWRYVEMLPTKNSKGYLMYSKGDLPTRTYGWLKASDIK